MSKNKSSRYLRDAMIFAGSFALFSAVTFASVKLLNITKIETAPIIEPAPIQVIQKDPEPEIVDVLPETPTVEDRATKAAEPAPIRPAPTSPGPALKQPERPMVASAPDMSSTAYWPIIKTAAKHLELDPALLHGVIVTESRYRPHAVSKRGAIGLMQLKPDAGARDAYKFLYGRRGTPTAEGLRKPDVNIWLGAGYLRMLHDEYLNDVPEPARMHMVLAAYNWGVGNVRRALRSNNIPSTPSEALAWIDKHSPEETRNYVRSVMQYQQQQLALNTYTD